MSNRLVHLLLLAAGLYSAGAITVLFSGGVTAPAAVRAPTPRATTPSAQAAVLLPVVTVRPDAPVPTLATVTVRAPAPYVANAETKTGAYSLGSAIATGATSPLAALPGSSFDMPYYSFGKSLRRASKE